ncbi:MAG: hypothetical protein ABIE03_01770 [Patescibacteria group bacterium]
MINKSFVLNTLTKSLGLKRVKNPCVGDTIELSPREAFLYAVLSAHGYLDISEPECRFFLKRDYYRIFNQAEEYNIQEGLMSISDLSFSCTPRINVLEKPYILKGYKYLLPIEYEKYSLFLERLKEISKELIQNNYNPNDYIIIPIRKGLTKVSEFESFFEFIISSYFSKFGFFTDTQIPFYYGVGTPDASIYRVDELSNALTKYGVGFRGYSLIELMTITTFGLDKVKNNTKSFQDWKNAVFEVKTLQSSAPQIEKYISKQIFHKAFEVIPFKKDASSYSGLITFNAEGDMTIIDKNSTQITDYAKESRYNKWLDTYIKFYLLANLSTDSLEKMSKELKFPLDSIGLINYLKDINYDGLINYILHYVKNR